MHVCCWNVNKVSVSVSIVSAEAGLKRDSVRVSTISQKDDFGVKENVHEKQMYIVDT